jgi:hypothetical protein
MTVGHNRLAAFGIELGLPLGWEARIFRRAPSHVNERTYPVLHAATFSLPPNRGDFGAGAVESMSAVDVFVALFEYGPDAVGQPLFAAQGIPKIDAGMFSPSQLQCTIKGQSGCQRFFTAAGRAFCLYVVLGGHTMRFSRAATATDLLGSLSIVPSAPMAGR